MRQLDVIFDFQYCLRVWEKCAQHTKNMIVNASRGVLDRKELKVNFWVQLCLKSMGEVCSTYEKYNR